MEFRALKENEIDVRVGQIYPNKGVTFLLYKDARVDANILDETVGAENWQDRYYEVKGNLYCSVGINTNYEKPELGDRWIWKDDCGRESNIEKEKGEASDAFKRACATRWSIGRELYTSPFIYVKAENLKKLEQNKTTGKWTCNDKLRVKYIEVIDGKIEKLIIYNSTTKQDVVTYGVTK